MQYYIFFFFFSCHITFALTLKFLLHLRLHWINIIYPLLFEEVNLKSFIQETFKHLISRGIEQTCILSSFFIQGVSCEWVGCGSNLCKVYLDLIDNVCSNQNTQVELGLNLF